MGYESRIYIVERADEIWSYNRYCWSYEISTIEIAKFNLGKVPFLSDKMREQPATDCFVYADDGETHIVEDKYGKLMTEAKPEFVIEVLEEYIASGGDNRRVYPLLAALKAIEDRKDEWKSVVVLHYGY